MTRKGILKSCKEGFHLSYSQSESRRNQAAANHSSREEGSANNTVKKQVSLFIIRENGENCLGLFQTIWNISAATADYMLFSTLYFLHTHNKLVLCAVHAGCVQ